MTTPPATTSKYTVKVRREFLRLERPVVPAFLRKDEPSQSDLPAGAVLRLSRRDALA